MENAYPLHNKSVFVAGHRGMVGSAVVRRLAAENCEILVASRDELDLRDQSSVRRWLADRRPDAVVLAAAKVGGILANDTYPADFLYDNLVIETNVIEGCIPQRGREADLSRILLHLSEIRAAADCGGCASHRRA